MKSNIFKEEIAKRLLLSSFIFISALTSSAQVADEEYPHYRGEKFDHKYLKTKIGSLDIAPRFHPTDDAFWYSFKASASERERYYYYDNQNGLIDCESLRGYDERAKEINSKIPAVPLVGYTTPDNLWAFRLYGRSLFLESKVNGKLYSLNDDCGANYIFDTKNSVWLDSDTYVMPLHNYLEVNRYTVINSVAEPKPLASSYFYENPGDASISKTELWYGHISTKKHVKLDVEKWKGQRTKLLVADGISGKVYFTRQKRTNDIVELCRINLDGKVEVVVTEESHPIINHELFDVHFIDGDREILVWSDRTGWGHYYRYDNTGRLLGSVTKGEWTAGKIVYSNSEYIIVEGYGKESGVNPNYCYYYLCSLDGKECTLLTPEQGTHSLKVSPNGHLLVDTWSRNDKAPVINLRNEKGELIRQLHEANVDALYAYGWKHPEAFNVKAADGITDLYGLMYKPSDFDPNKKYPIISQVYPGPVTETVFSEFTVIDRYQNAALADRGFIVVVIGHRGGSPYRNKAYYQYGHGNLRDYPLEDDVCGIRQLADLYSFVDTTRVGIMGHSGGAFMAFAAMCTYPDFYKACVASSGNHDNYIYTRQWGENYQGITDDIASFHVDTNMDIAHRLKGHLLLVTGESDKNVNPAHTYRLAAKLMEYDKDFDMLVLPGQEHHYTGFYEDYFQRRKRDFFEKWLKTDQ